MPGSHAKVEAAQLAPRRAQRDATYALGHRIRPHTTTQPRDARILDARLWQISRAEAQADLELARGLAKLWDDQLYRPLGFVRSIDFIRELLGIQGSRARWLTNLGRELIRVPEFDAALAEGRISASHVIELAKIVKPATSEADRAAWIERASGKTVRALRMEIQTERQRLATTDSVAPSDAGRNPIGREGNASDKNAGEDVDGKSNNGQHTEGKSNESGNSNGPGNSDDPGNPDNPGNPDDPGNPDVSVEIIDLTVDPDEIPAGGRMSIPAPERVAILWHHALELSRSASGCHLSPGQCAELIVADYLAAVGNEAPEETERVEAALRNEERQRRVDEVIRAMDRQHTTRSRPRVRIDPDSDDTPQRREERWPAVDWRAPAGNLPEECRVTGFLDAWELARALMNLAQLKKELRYDLAELLERLRIGHDWHRLGFKSLDEYCDHRLGFGRRRAERLIQFHRGLDKYERLRHAYLTSGISYTAALLLLRILNPKTETIWVQWADGVTYRELERVVEFAATYMLPEADPAVFASYIRELERLTAEEAEGIEGLASGESAAERSDTTNSLATPDSTDVATTFAIPGSEPTECPTRTSSMNQPADIPLGCALPPDKPGGLPIIAGLPTDLALAPPEFCITRIRFWVPAEVLELVYRALRCCRLAMQDPLRDTWAYLEVILVHFINSQDTPAAREVMRRHKVIARDRFQCRCAGCTSRSNLHGHHLEHLAQGGSNDDCNLATICAGHHLHGLHGGVVEMGGWAPDHLITKLGINPRTGRPLVCYINEHRVNVEQADAELTTWRAVLRRGESAGS